ncbi:MAG: metal ABC transporter permease [Mariprofundaceae bacterium]|nr:metal ABC transporter permease [Mariprofundaceae bacterium]
MLHDFLTSPVIHGALIPAGLIAVVTASMSVMILAHRLSFLTVGISHASLAGMGLAVTLSLPLLPTATIISCILAVLLAWVPKSDGISEDTGTGLLFAGSMALGIVLLSQVSQSDVNLFSLLFGDILTVNPDEYRWLAFIAVLILLLLLVFGRRWWSIAFDPVTAAAAGLPVGALRILLYATVGMTVMMCVKLAGIVLTTGMLVLPAATAWFWGHSLRMLWVISMLVALTGTYIGLYISYVQDWPSGATVVLMLCCMFILSWGISWIKKEHGKKRLGQA